MSQSGTPSTQEKRLRRDIGFFGSAFLSFNGIVGAGIFALPATLYQQFGVFSPWLFPLFGLLMLVLVLPFARLATYFPESGGPVAYTAVFGSLTSFQVGWLYYLARVTALAANANVFTSYATSLWAPVGTPVGRAATIVLLFGAVTIINIVGVRRAIRLLDVLTLLKGLPLLLLALWGLAAADVIPAPGPWPSLTGIEAAVLVILYAFIGFENSVVPAGETANPGRNIPRALVATIIATTALYFVVQLAYVSIMPAGQGTEAPLVAFARSLAGPIGGFLLIGVALCSIGGNTLGSIISTPRVTFALSHEGLLPRWFGVVSERYRTPANSILFTGLLGMTLALTGSFVWLAVVSTLARLLVYAASIAALGPVQRREGKRNGAGTIALVAAAMALCLWAALQSRWPSWRLLLLLVAIGSLLYVLARWQARRPHPAG